MPIGNRRVAEQVAGKAGRGEHQEQVVLGDAELDVLAFVVAAPLLRRRNLCLGEDVGHVAAAEQAALVDPGAEVGRDGDVGRGGDDPVGEVAAGLRQVEQDAAERGLRRLLVAGRGGDRGDRDVAEAARALVAGDAAALEQRLDAGPRIVADAFERLPFLALAHAHRLAQRGHLGRVHQAGVIVLVAGEGQAEALDRPGDEQGRDVVLRGVERLDQRLHAMAAEVGEQRRERGVVMLLEEGRCRLAELGVDPRAPRRAALIVERRQFGVGQLLEPGLELRMLVERGLQPLAVAQLDDAPAAASEDLVEPLEHAVGAGRVEALAVVVDDPPQVADVVLGALDDRFVDIALVELGIADQRDEAAAVLLVQPAVGGEIILHEAGEERDRDAEADRAGREIDRDPVLGPARIALRAAEAAEILERLARSAMPSR